ncbi:MAG TPA: hypothetical protein VGL65_12170 [Gemmatimonadales bacterium]
MPVTAKLSKAFYDQFGEQIVGELVDWFNQVDATYHNDLRELNELNFARFDAKVEQRLAELRADLSAQISAVETRLEGRFGALEIRLERRLGEHSRWLIGMWIIIICAAAALWFRHQV